MDFLNLILPELKFYFESFIKSLNLINILISFSIFIIVLLLRGFLAIIIKKQVQFFISFKNLNNSKKISESFNGLINFFIFFLAFFVFSLILDSSEKVGGVLGKINLSLFTILIFWLAQQIIQPLIYGISNIHKIFTADLLEWIIKALKVIIFILGFSAVLELWGIKVGAIIAGLGLFGVAVALGAQDLFKNLISGILVLVEKRFKKGDVIIIQNIIEGTVEKIGFRSTAIRKFDKSICYIPNFQFAENAVINISETTYRRVNWIIGLEYKSSVSQLKNICNDIEKFIIGNPKDFKVSKTIPVIVKIDEFADSSINILIRCFANTNNYNEFVSIKDRFAIELKKIIEKRKGSFAFPSQSLYIEKGS